MSAIPTNHGPMNAAQIVDTLMYSSYAHNRDLGMSAERLARFFDVETFEPIYRAEHRGVEA